MGDVWRARSDTWVTGFEISALCHQVSSRWELWASLFRFSKCTFKLLRVNAFQSEGLPEQAQDTGTPTFGICNRNVINFPTISRTHNSRIFKR